MTNTTRLHKEGQAPDGKVPKLQLALETCRQERNVAWTRLLELQVEHEAHAAEWFARLADMETRADRERTDHAGQCAQWQQTVSEKDAELQAVHLSLAERDQRIESLSQEIVQTDRQRQQGTQDLRAAERQIATLHAAIAALESQLEAACAAARADQLRLAELYRSSSWRITAPLRFAKRRWPRIRSLVSSWLQALYLALPLPWSVKLRIKGLLFALFSPLLGHTRAYQAWLAFEKAKGAPSPASP